MSQIFQLKPSSRNTSLLKIARALLLDDKVIITPTDTIYGLAASLNSPNAIQRLYNIKERSVNNPLAICVADIDEIYKYSDVTVSKNLLSELLPGAVTVLFCRNTTLNSYLNPNTQLVGIRIPDHDFVRGLSRLSGPIALTSANISSHSSCLKIDEFQSLWSRVDAIFDGGTLGHIDPHRLGSTIVDLSCQGQYKIVRKGCVYDQVVTTLTKYGLRSCFD